MPDRLANELREALPRLLADPAAVRVPDGVADRRAAVTLVLSPNPLHSQRAEALLVVRAQVAGDPWSGQVALPGGRVEEGDADLLDTARRELEEETGVNIAPAGYLGRLDDLHPRSPHLPSIAVTPFVAWLSERTPVAENRELAGHLWVPLRDLASPVFRSSLRREAPVPKMFETVELGDFTIWGMTLSIIDNFLNRISAGTR
ncbi:MAG: CoA pyrophosphatase [Gemmatimonadota bacterium]|nr:CoA pyrophosphatase [Gemmatimonadota bacterium]MDH3427168.1 CoA pyrophosphatase [Gemmatimonadota bacterium]